jgi:hypothetical protein
MLHTREAREHTPVTDAPPLHDGQQVLTLERFGRIDLDHELVR